jgi:hypothetical protein
MTSLGKKARWLREMREGLNVRLRCASAFAKATADKPTRQVRRHNGEAGRPFKPQFPGLSSDGLGNEEWTAPRKPRGCPEAKARVARPHPNSLSEKRELTKAALGGLNPIKPNQTKSNLHGGGAEEKWPVVSGEWLVLHSRYTAQSDQPKPVKAGQTGSNPVKPGVGGWEWPVAIGWWRKSSAEYRPVKPGQSQSNPVKAGQTESNQIKPNQTESNSSNRSNPVKPSQTSQTQSKSGTRRRSSLPKSQSSQTSQTGHTPVKPVKPVKPSQTSQTQSNQSNPSQTGLTEACARSGSCCAMTDDKLFCRASDER